MSVMCGFAGSYLLNAATCLERSARKSTCLTRATDSIRALCRKTVNAGNSVIPKARSIATEDIKPGNVPESRNGISKPNLFPFLVRSPIVTNRCFENRALQLCHFRCYLNFEAESFGIDDHFADYFSAESLISSFDVS